MIASSRIIPRAASASAQHVVRLSQQPQLVLDPGAPYVDAQHGERGTVQAIPIDVVCHLESVVDALGDLRDLGNEPLHIVQ
jgi:hypothetical protein